MLEALVTLEHKGLKFDYMSLVVNCFLVFKMIRIIDRNQMFHIISLPETFGLSSTLI